MTSEGWGVGFAVERTCPGLGGDGRPHSGLEAGGRDGEAAVCRRPSGNSAPLHTNENYKKQAVSA
jgi:hypothetical protein